MTSPRSAACGRNPRRSNFEFRKLQLISELQLMLTMALAASKATAGRGQSPKAACKPRANCLNPKEIRNLAQTGRRRRFDLRHLLNYLMVVIA
jgi:hypothetical protein